MIVTFWSFWRNELNVSIVAVVVELRWLLYEGQRWKKKFLTIRTNCFAISEMDNFCFHLTWIVVGHFARFVADFMGRWFLWLLKSKQTFFFFAHTLPHDILFTGAVRCIIGGWLVGPPFPAEIFEFSRVFGWKFDCLPPTPLTKSWIRQCIVKILI